MTLFRNRRALDAPAADVEAVDPVDALLDYCREGTKSYLRERESDERADHMLRDLT